MESDNRIRTALVTGGARGLGEAIGRALHADGLNVVLADIADAQARSVATSLDPRGVTAWALALDVRDAAAWERAFAAVTSRHGRVDVLVNNAGVVPVRDLLDITVDEWDDVLAINLRGAFIGCQLAARQMKENGWGRIINLGSIAGQIGSRLGGAHYSASKAGVICLTKVVAKELAPFGVTVNAIAPAVVRVPLMDLLPRDRLGALIESIPVGRVGEADEVGALAAFLASEMAGYITGTTIDINGGQYMR